jgi:hypothetical protein
MIRLWELAMLFVIIAITKIHADKFAHNRAISPTFHFLWAVVYFIPCAVISYLTGSWWLAVAFILLRFVAYNIILNVWRTRPFFYIHSGLNGSWWDELELHWANLYGWIWGVGVIALIIINFIL